MTRSHPTRKYDATRRREAADQTYREIIRVAQELFLTHGYTGTTMQAIASQAGVVLDTVYAVVGRKPVLLQLLIELAISGQDRAIPAPERAYVREMRAEPDPKQKLAIYARAICAMQPRLAPMFRVLREAARSDSDLAARWQEIADRRASNMRLLAAELESAAGGLRTGVTVDEAADFIWATNSPEYYLLLVEERGWDIQRYQKWLTEMWQRMLLGD